MLVTNEHLRAAIKAIHSRFDAQDGDCIEPASLVIPGEYIAEVCKTLRDEFNFKFLSDVTATDYWPEEEPRFHVIYNLLSHSHNVRLCLRMHLNGDSPSIHTIEDVFPNANWYERELWDMFGIHIEGHSDLRRILMPYDWEGHPLRKDYPLGYEEPQFTFNFDEIAQRKHRGTYEEA
jgi:NADH-quinone oxidoreductase subunit C